MGVYQGECLMNRARIFVAALALTSVAASAAPVMSETARNPHNFTLKLDYDNFVKGEWSGDAEFTIAACPEPSCFRLSGKASLPLNPSTSLNEGTFPIPRLACDLHFVEVPHDGMDSGDWRLTLSSRDHAGNGCASLPSGLAGVYREVD